MCEPQPEQPTSFNSADTTPFGPAAGSDPSTTAETTASAPQPPADHTPPPGPLDDRRQAGRRTSAAGRKRWTPVALLAALALAGGLVAIATVPRGAPRPRPAAAQHNRPAGSPALTLAAIEPAISSHMLRRTTTSHQRAPRHQPANQNHATTHTREHAPHPSPAPTETVASTVNATSVAQVTTEAAATTTTTPAPVTSQAPATNATSDSSSTDSQNSPPAHQPAFGANGSLGPGHGIGTS